MDADNRLPSKGDSDTLSIFLPGYLRLCGPLQQVGTVISGSLSSSDESHSLLLLSIKCYCFSVLLRHREAWRWPRGNVEAKSVEEGMPGSVLCGVAVSLLPCGSPLVWGW